MITPSRRRDEASSTRIWRILEHLYDHSHQYIAPGIKLVRIRQTVADVRFSFSQSNEPPNVVRPCRGFVSILLYFLRLRIDAFLRLGKKKGRQHDHECKRKK